MSTGGRWVNGEWKEYRDFNEVMAEFLAAHLKATPRLRSVSHRKETKPDFKPRNLLGVSPAEYRRRHLGKI
jgi:hypothetical protein